MDKEDVVHIYNGILLSHEMERNWVICRDMDASRDCHIEWTPRGESGRGWQWRCDELGDWY